LSHAEVTVALNPISWIWMYLFPVWKLVHHLDWTSFTLQR